MPPFIYEQRVVRVLRSAACTAGLIISLSAAGFVEAQPKHEGPPSQSGGSEEKEPTLAEAKAAFARADRALNQAWSAAKAAMTGHAAAELTQSQREWLRSRDYRAGFESEQAGQRDAGRSAVWHAIAAELSESRAEWLRARAQASKKPPETMTGLWIDSYGGTLSIVEQEGRLLFTCEVVRGPTYHTGGVAGFATWNEKIGWFSDKGRDPAKTGETNIAFIARDGCLELIGAKTSDYHGARAYFDGMYCRTRTLNAEEQAELIKAAESGEIGADAVKEE